MFLTISSLGPDPFESAAGSAVAVELWFVPCVDLDISTMSRVYIGRISDSARDRDVERFFKGYGRVREILLKNGYGFVVCIFVNRSCDVWNSLPELVVDACSVDGFKRRLGVFWIDEDALFDRHSVITRTGNRSSRKCK